MSSKISIRSIPTTNGAISDIEVQLSEHEYQKLLRKFPQRDRHWQSACYTYLVQTEIAKYFGSKPMRAYSNELNGKIKGLMGDLRTCTEQYAPFEALINNPPSLNAQANIAFLLTALRKHKNWLATCNLPKELTDILTTKIDEFEKKLQKLEWQAISRNDCRQIFSIQDENLKLPSIGAFIAENMWHITNQGIETLYQYTDESNNQYSQNKLWNRIKQVLLYQMHPAIQALSDAKAHIEVKGRSLHGMRYNNSKSPIPQSMLDSLGPIPGAKKGELKKWTSLKPFVSNLNDFEKLDVIIASIEGQSYPEHITQPHFLLQLLVFAANITELGIVLVTRVPYVVVSTALHLVLARPFESLLSLLYKKPVSFFSAGFDKADAWTAEIHEKYSPVRYAKHFRNEGYELHNKSLMRITNNTHSLYCTILNEFSAEKVSAYIAQGLKSLAHTLAAMYHEPRYLIMAGAMRSEAIVQQYQQEMDTNFLTLLEAKLKSVKKDGYNKRPPIEPWTANQIPMPIDYAVEIGVGLPDGVIGPMSRKSPGAATLFFMLSNASLAALFAGEGAGEAVQLLGMPATVLSKIFRGKEITHSLVGKVIGVFLQWKIGFFSAEALASMMKGDYEFLKNLFHEPEKMTLSFSLLIAIGWAMKYIPEIPEQIKNIPLPIDIPGFGAEVPNFYVYLIVMFIHESKECAHGQWPANFLEYAVLALKFGFLCEGLLSGTHKIVIPEIIASLKEALLEKGMRADKMDIPYFKELLHKHHIMESHECFGLLLDSLQKAVKDTGLQVAEIQAKTKEVITILQKPKVANDPLEIVTGKITKALQTAQKMDVVGEPFKSRTHARFFFDYLKRNFAEYNRLQRASGNALAELDEEYLHSFYSKYCHKGSNNLLRLLSIIPFYPFTKFYQMSQKWLAIYCDAPSTLYKLSKSEAKNTAMLWQLVAMGGRIGHELLRSYTYSLRAVVCLCFVPFALISVPFSLPLLLCKKSPFAAGFWLMNTAIDLAGSINLHRGRWFVGKSMETAYAASAHLASTNSEDLSFQHAKMMRILLQKGSTKAETKEEQHKQPEYHTDLWANKDGPEATGGHGLAHGPGLV